MRISTNNDRPIVDGEIVEYLVDHIRHCMIFPLGIPSGNQSEVMHEIHQLGDISLGFLVPHRCRVTTRLVCTIHSGGYDGGGHRFQFL